MQSKLEMADVEKKRVTEQSAREKEYYEKRIKTLDAENRDLHS